MNDGNAMQAISSPTAAPMANEFAPLAPRRGRARTWPTSAMPDLGRPALPAAGQSSFVATNTTPMASSSSTWTPGAAIDPPAPAEATQLAVPAPYLRDDWQLHQTPAAAWGDTPVWTDAPLTPRTADSWTGSVAQTGRANEFTAGPSQWAGEVAVAWNARPESWSAPAPAAPAARRRPRMLWAAVALTVLVVLGLVLSLV